MENRSIESLSDTLVSQPANPKESAQNNIIKEMVETERKYVQDLEIMQVRTVLIPILACSPMFIIVLQKYSNALAQANLMDQDTIHHLFPNLNKLLNFQRKFLIRLESTAELPWQEQRWGQHFLESVSPCFPYALTGVPIVLALTPCFFRLLDCPTIGRRIHRLRALLC